MTDEFLKYTIDCLRDMPTSVSIALLAAYCIGTVLLLTFLGIKKGVRWSARLLLGEYLLLLFFLTVLFRNVQTSREFEFVPFWSYRVIRDRGYGLLSLQMIMNVVAFIPVGVLIGISFRRMKWWRVLIFAIAFSLLIETLQFLLKRGFAEFDDVFHNVLGCMIGYWLYLANVQVTRTISNKRAIASKTN